MSRFYRHTQRNWNWTLFKLNTVIAAGLLVISAASLRGAESSSEDSGKNVTKPANLQAQEVLNEKEDADNENKTDEQAQSGQQDPITSMQKVLEKLEDNTSEQLRAFQGVDVASVTEVKQSINSLLKDITEWETNIAPAVTDSRTQNLLRQAEAYGKEREFRRLLAEQMQTLVERVKLREFYHRTILQKQKKKIQRLKTLLKQEKNKAEGERSAGSAADEESSIENLYSFKFYEVPEETTLQKLSGKQEVYGDSGMWRLLWKANKKKIPSESADATIEAGTVLTIPKAPVKRKFEFK